MSASTVSADTQYETGSTSANTASAPVSRTALAVAMKVNDGTTTWSPGPTPRARRASSRAVVPFETAEAWRAPIVEANSSSNAST